MYRRSFYGVIPIIVSFLFIFYSTCFGEIQCDIVSGYDWDYDNESTWTTDVYQLTIQCVDTSNGNAPVAGYVADFEAIVNLRTTGDLPLHTVPLKSTTTNADGLAYLTTALIHTPANDASNIVHQCPFDDIECPTTPSPSPPLRFVSASNLRLAAQSTGDPIDCIAHDTGCCYITHTIKNCDPPIVLNTYCTNTDQFTCDYVIPYSDAYIEIATFYHPDLICNTCAMVCEEETLIELSSLVAVPGNRKITINWETAAEIDNAGFNIYRAEAVDGQYVQINNALITAEGSATAGASYEFIDDDVQNRTTYWYQLEDNDLNGVTTLHGPVSATPRLVYGIIR